MKLAECKDGGSIWSQTYLNIGELIFETINQILNNQINNQMNYSIQKQLESDCKILRQVTFNLIANMDVDK